MWRYCTCTRWQGQTGSIRILIRTCMSCLRNHVKQVKKVKIFNCFNNFFWIWLFYHNVSFLMFKSDFHSIRTIFKFRWQIKIVLQISSENLRQIIYPIYLPQPTYSHFHTSLIESLQSVLASHCVKPDSLICALHQSSRMCSVCTQLSGNRSFPSLRNTRGMLQQMPIVTTNSSWCQNPPSSIQSLMSMLAGGKEEGCDGALWWFGLCVWESRFCLTQRIQCSFGKPRDDDDDDDGDDDGAVDEDD